MKQNKTFFFGILGAGVAESKYYAHIRLIKN